MSRKKLEVIELNKKKNKIILAEEQSAILLFFRRHATLIYLTVLILSLTIVGISLIVTMKNIRFSEQPIIKETSVDVSLADYNAIIGDDSLTEDSAKDTFLNGGKFKHNGEVILIKKVETGKYTIYYYSDMTSVKVNKDGRVTRIEPTINGEYGIKENGVIFSNVKTSDVTIKNTKNFDWGVVSYLSDGSAIVTDSKMDIFVRNANDIGDNYISNNKVTYLKDTKNIGGDRLYYYYDGTIEVVKKEISYVVRSSDDLNITDHGVNFKNNNEATIYNTFKTKDGYQIDYYTDGGAIIRNGSKTISVRKSNSIIIKDNKIYEIVDNIYVEVSNSKNGVTYYTNGGAVIDNYNGNTVYVDENSNIKYQGNSISNVTGDIEKLTNETNVGGENTKIFEKTAVVKTSDYIAIVPKNKVIFNPDGKVKEIEDISVVPTKDFTITNNTNEKIKYRVVLEKSDRTTVNTEYLRYQLTTKDKYVEPTKLDSVIWKNDNISDSLGVTGTNYILVDGSLEAYDTDNINLMLWTDYDTIPNSEQDKYFYGTIRVYAWTEIEK